MRPPEGMEDDVETRGMARPNHCVSGNTRHRSGKTPQPGHATPTSQLQWSCMAVGLII